MAKLVLMSALFAMAIIPAIAAKDRRPRRGLKVALLGVVVFNLVYLMALLFIYPKIAF
jgi:hypothetical protein